MRRECLHRCFVLRVRFRLPRLSSLILVAPNAARSCRRTRSAFSNLCNCYVRRKYSQIFLEKLRKTGRPKIKGHFRLGVLALSFQRTSLMQTALRSRTVIDESATARHKRRGWKVRAHSAKVTECVISRPTRYARGVVISTARSECSE